MLIQPFLWDFIPSDPAADLLTEVVVDSETDPDECALETEIRYVVPPSGRFDLTITLKVTQVPVRGVVRTHTDVRTIRLPTYFKRGDANLDSEMDISDAIYLLGVLFGGCVVDEDEDCEPDCEDAADANDDEALDISDAIYVLGYLFVGGDPPPPPFSEMFDECGADPTPEEDDEEADDGDLGCQEPLDYCD